MIDWSSLDAREALRLYVAERTRRAYPPSLAGLDPDMPVAPSPALPSGYFEQLCRLTADLSQPAIRILEMRFLGWTTTTCIWRAIPPTRYRNLTEYYAAPEAERGQLTELWEQVPVAPTDEEIARKLGLKSREVRALRCQAEAAVAERLGRMRGDP